MKIVNNVEIDKDFVYELDNLGDNERMFILTSIDTKFSAMSDLIRSIQKDLDLIHFECRETYKISLDTLNSTMFVFSDYLFAAIDKDNILEKSRIY